MDSYAGGMDLCQNVAPLTLVWLYGYGSGVWIYQGGVMDLCDNGAPLKFV